MGDILWISGGSPCGNGCFQACLLMRQLPIGGTPVLIKLRGISKKKRTIEVLEFPHCTEVQGGSWICCRLRRAKAGLVERWTELATRKTEGIVR